MYKVLGIDPSLTGTGLVLLEDGKMIEKALIISKPVGKKPKDELTRILKIVDQIEDFFKASTVHMAAIEGIAFGIGKTTSLAQLSGLNYLIRSMLMFHGIPFVVVAPTSLKKFATGKGTSQKDQMMLEVYKRWGVSILDNNVCDAYALAQVAHAMINQEYKATKTQTEVIDLVKTQL
jgi:crossover junction endodeoxyribonuclease RuvC